jgi:hypothetical protein
MQIIETNLPTNGSFSCRNNTDEIILHPCRSGSRRCCPQQRTQWIN